ncbi:MAG: hypothetical protein AAFX40_17920, partial [Cyanobacteria bacterium J06639_1]
MSCSGSSDRLGRVLPIVPECLSASQRDGYAAFYADASAPVTYPLLPEIRFQPIARLDANAIASGANLRVTNQSDTDLIIQVIGETEPRELSVGEAIDLSGLPLPMTLTAERRDRGAL